MNNNDISYFVNMLNKMDEKQLSDGINKINQILSPEEKKKIIENLNSKKK